jgi:hypothetical protein
VDTWHTPASGPLVYSPELRQRIRQHVSASIAGDDDTRKMGVYLEQEFDRVLALWLTADEKNSAHISQALAICWMTAAALTYFYLVEDIIEAAPAEAEEAIGLALYELERAMDRTGDWPWGVEIARGLLTKILDHNDHEQHPHPEN